MTTQMLAPKQKILAVDDDADLLGLLELVLVRAGFDVAVAADGPEALRYVDAEHPDLMVLDLTMPQMSGLTVLQELGRRARRPRVVCLTGRTDSQPREKAWALGVDDYVTKPFGVNRIVEVVREVARRDWALRELHRRTALDGLSWT